MLLALMMGTPAGTNLVGLNWIFLYSSVPSLFAVVILVALLDDRTCMRNRMLVLLGESSFVLYLIHKRIFAGHFLVRVLHFSRFYNLLLMAMVAIGMSMLFHLYVESKVTRIVKRCLLKVLVRSEAGTQDPRMA